MIGKIKWFNPYKGYGFIHSNDYKSDIFIHFSSIIMDGYKTLEKNQVVEFDVKIVDNKPQAVNVRAK